MTGVFPNFFFLKKKPQKMTEIEQTFIEYLLNAKT